MGSLARFHEWILNDFFMSPIVKADMSQNDRGLFPGFIASLWSTRAEWALAHNIELQTFDIRANTFVEANFAALTEHVGVNANMSAPTFVRREDLANVSRQNKRQFEAFRDATRRYSHKDDSEWTDRFELAEEVLMPRPLQILKNQILLGASCARNSATKIALCTTDIDSCVLCRTYMTATQKARHNSTTLRLHLLCYLDDEGQKKTVRFSSVLHDFVELLRAAPTPKHWRVVTCHMVPNGCLFLCSCGYGMRNLTCCLHASLLMQKVSQNQLFGCEEETIHVRHTNLFAALQDGSIVCRSHDDWQGVFSSAISAADITSVVPANAMNDTECQSAVDQESKRAHGHATRHQQNASSKRDAERVSKSQILASLRSHVQDVVNVIESMQLDDVRTKVAEFETVILDFKKTLPMLPLRAQTTRARLPAAQAAMKRRGKSKGQKKKAKEAAAPPTMQRKAASAHAASGSAQQPIRLTSSGSNSSHSDSESAAESAAESDDSSVGAYGFRYGPERDDQYGFSEDDIYSSEDLD